MGDGDLSDEILGAPKRSAAGVPQNTDGSVSDLILNGPDYGTLRMAGDQGLRLQPDRAARILRMQAKTGIPEDLIEPRLEEVEQQAKASTFDAEQFRKNSPLMAKWLQESPNRIAVMQPDLAKLSDLEQVYRLRNDWTRPLLDPEIQRQAEAAAQRRSILASKGSRYVPNLSSGELEDLGEDIPPEKFYDGFLKEELAARRAENDFLKNPQTVGFGEALSDKWRTNPMFLVPFYGQVPELANAWDVYNAAKSVQAAQAAGKMPDAGDQDTLARFARMETAANKRGLSLGGKLAEFGAGTLPFIMEMAATGGLSELAGVSAKQAVSGVARGAARKLVGAAAEWATQAATAEGLKRTAGVIRRQTPIGEATVDDQGNFHYEVTSDTGEPILESMRKEAAGALIDIATGKVPIGPLYQILEKQGGQAVAKALSSRLMRVGTEGIKGAMSGITVNEAAKLANALTEAGPAYQLPSGEDALVQGLGFGALGAWHGLTQQADNTVRTVEGQRSILDAMKATKSEPALTEQAIEAATKGTPEEFVYLPAESVQRFYQSKGLDPRTEMTKVLGSSEKYDQAAEAGHDIQIPTSRYAMTIDRDPEASKFFQSKVKFDPMDASREELDSLIQAGKEQKQPAAQAAQPTPDQQFEESGKQVARFIQGRMKELGFTREAEAYGKLFEERYKARAERRGMGEMPLELLDKLGLGIFKREGPGGEAPEGEASYAKVLEQGAAPRIERVPGETPAETALNAGQMFPGATVEPLTPEEAGRQVFEQPGGTPRGNIEFGPEGVDINLFRKADRSTFLHESGHLWLDELIQDATTAGTSEGLRKDLDTVLKSLGSEATSLQGGREIRKALTEQQQEKWAGMVESYLMEGKAPSNELRGVFYRFANWLKRIYKSLTGLESQAGQKLDLSPDVRDVMDRLLASDQQIDGAKSQENVHSLLANADWLPAKSREEISNALAGVDRQAKEELHQKLMAEVRKEESAQWEREKDGVRKEIAREVDQRPEQIALANLERGTRPDGSPLGPEDLPAIKISRGAALQASEGDKAKAFGGLPRRIFAKEGVTPDEAAEYFGFSSGDELLTALRGLYEPQTPEARAIKEKLDALELTRKLLVQQKQPLEAESEEAIKNLKKGRKTLANKLERAIRDEEKSKLEPINEILDDIRDRGGIRPTEPTEDLPDAYRARKAEKGVPSDEIAQELYDRGHLDYPDSDALYKKLTEWQQAVKDSKERIKGAEGEARRLAGERISSSIEQLVENTKEQERLRVELAKLQSETAAAKREHQPGQREALLDRLADERMRERFPDMLTDGSLPEEAQKVVYNAQRAKLMAREMELLAEHKVPAMKRIVEALAKRGGFSELMKAQAEEQIEKGKIREITPGQFKIAARVAGRRSIEAYNKGDFTEAFRQKRLELLNHELYRAAEKVGDAVDSGVRYADSLSTDRVRGRIGKAGGDYLEQLDKILERFEFRKVPFTELARRGESLRAWHDSLERLARDGEGYMPDIPARVLDEAWRTNYRDMTYEEFQDVIDAMKNIDHLSMLKNQLLASADKREFRSTVDGAVDSIKANGGPVRKKSLEPRRPGMELKKRGVEGYFADLRKIASLVREMDGFKDGGPMWDLLVRPANAAGNREASMQAEAAEKYSKIMDAYTPAERLSMYQREYIPEINDSLSRWGQIMVALNSGNDGNLQRVKDGYRWNDAQIQAIHDRLTPKDWQTVKDVWKLIDTYWPEIRDLNRRVTGLAPEKVEARPFMTKYGEIEGGYFPIKYEPIISPVAGEQAQVDEAKPTLLGASVRSTTAHGHREARMEHVERPIRLDPGVISQHINQVIHDITHYEFVVDTNRVLRDSKMQDAIYDHYGDQNFLQMKNWLRDIAVGLQPAKTQGERVLNSLRQGSMMSRLALNLGQFISFQTGIFQGAKRIGPEWVARGWAEIGSDAMRMENAISKITDKSEFMANRWRTSLREANEVTGRIVNEGRGQLLADVAIDKLTGGRWDLNDLRNTFFIFMHKCYQLQDAPTWIGAYKKALAEHSIESAQTPEEREGIDKRAVAMADQAVIDSYGGGQIKDLAGTQRGSAAWKAFTAFGTWANVTLQHNIESGARWWKQPKTIGSHMRLASDIALVNIIPAAAVTALGYALSNNPKSKKELGADFLKDQVANVFGQDPILNQLTPAIRGQDYEGPKGLEFFQVASRLIKSGEEAIQHKDLKKIDLKAANQAGGVLFHYPSVFVQRVANAITESKRGAMEAAKAFLGGRMRK